MCYDKARRVIYYALENGKEPFREWVKKLNIREQDIIMTYVVRVRSGGAKRNIKNLGDGIFEIKIQYGPGFRIYFGNQGRNIILLLLGGDKGSQKRDISLAKKYWRNYVSN
ncbi:MAG: type II toxin-antitoxin system RelE/ParE family toxin [Deltaproteobacteria bacterium]|nr:MAG: type II toxin-antitoxin system RelE/ParE family toxin [Deltaproteobacteria bacterium]